MKLSGKILQLALLGLAIFVLGNLQLAAQNLAEDRPTVTSSNYDPAYAGDKAVDGDVNQYSKWTSANLSGSHWMYVDMESTQSVGSVTIKHAGAAGEPSYFNTQSYQIQWWTGSSWSLAASVNNSSQQNVTTSNVSFTARYVRLLVTDPGIDNIARIPEFEIFGVGGSNSAVLRTSGDSKLVWPYPNSQINCSNRMAGTDGWRVTCSTGCGAHQNSDYYADDWVTINSTTCQKPFYAPISGTVIYRGWSTGNDGGDWNYGNQVVIQSDQNSSFAFRVAHLYSISAAHNAYVNEGDLIGYIGTTGNSSGCHAHTVLYRNLNTSATNILDAGGYIANSYYAAPFYFDAACPGTRLHADAPTRGELVEKEVILEGLNKLAAEDRTELMVYPNPASVNAMAQFTIAQPGPVSLEILDVSGRLARPVLKEVNYPAGELRVEMDLLDLPSGIYFLRLDADGRKITRKLTISK